MGEKIEGRNDEVWGRAQGSRYDAVVGEVPVGRGWFGLGRGRRELGGLCWWGVTSSLVNCTSPLQHYNASMLCTPATLHSRILTQDLNLESLPSSLEFLVTCWLVAPPGTAACLHPTLRPFATWTLLIRTENTRALGHLAVLQQLIDYLYRWTSRKS